jgi:hypothetical protein
MVSESAATVEWLKTNHKLLWYRCGFNPEIKCDYITSNIAKSFNNWIRDHKDLPVANLADKIKEKIMVLWNKRRNMAYRLPEGRILPAIMVQLRANTRGLGQPAARASARGMRQRHTVRKNSQGQKRQTMSQIHVFLQEN